MQHLRGELLNKKILTGTCCLAGDVLHVGQACNHKLLWDGLHILRRTLPHSGEERWDGHSIAERQDRGNTLPIYQHAQVELNRSFVRWSVRRKVPHLTRTISRQRKELPEIRWCQNDRIFEVFPTKYKILDF